MVERTPSEAETEVVAAEVGKTPSEVEGEVVEAPWAVEVAEAVPP